MRTCGGCSGHVVKYGPPVRHGVFIDQIIYCPKPKCGWVGVETEIIDEKTYQPKPQQLSMFDLAPSVVK